MTKTKRKIRPGDSPELFKLAVSGSLTSSYLLPGDRVTKGQAISHLAGELRDRYGCNGVGWVLPGNLSDLASLLESSGFRVVRGRPLRLTRAGASKPYAPCQVVVPADYARLARPYG